MREAKGGKAREGSMLRSMFLSKHAHVHTIITRPRLLPP